MNMSLKFMWLILAMLSSCVTIVRHKIPVSFSSNVDGAEIFINGRSTGMQTPAIIKVKRRNTAIEKVTYGKRFKHVTFRKAGYRDTTIIVRTKGNPGIISNLAFVWLFPFALTTDIAAGGCFTLQKEISANLVAGENKKKRSVSKSQNTTALYQSAALPQPNDTCLWGNCQNGYGIFLDGNYNMYVGEFLNGQKAGYGIMQYFNGNKYFGSWNYNKYEGSGTLEFADGRKYKGAFQTNEFHGQGTLVFPDSFWTVPADSKLDGVSKKGNWNAGVCQDCTPIKMYECTNGDCENGNGSQVDAFGNTYVGHFKNNKYEDIGTYTNLATEEVYEGSWKNGLRNGNGVIHYADGRKYTGNFRNDTFWEVGTFTFPRNYKTIGTSHLTDGLNRKGKWTGSYCDDCIVFEPLAIDSTNRDSCSKVHCFIVLKDSCVNGNCQDGDGKLLFADGSTYEGTFEEGKRQGKGKMRYTDGREYEGYWMANKRSITGKMLYKDQIYEGEWKANLRHGKAKLTYANGNILESYFINDILGDSGSYFLVNGNQYNGQLKEGKMSGKGKMYESDGSFYLGQFNQNQRNGKGSYTFFNGVNYDGEFSNNEFHGFGIYTFPKGYMAPEGNTNWVTDGINKAGIWQNGEAIDLMTLENKRDEVLLEVFKKQRFRQTVSTNANTTTNETKNPTKLSKSADNLQARTSMNYKRSSLYTMMIYDVNRDMATEIKNTFGNVNIPEKYNDHNIGPYLINVGTKRTEAEIAAAQNKQENKNFWLGDDLATLATKNTNASTEEKTKALNNYLSQNEIARQMIEKWFNRSSEGYFDMNLVAERGNYNASEMDLRLAAMDIRGKAKISDAGEQLLANTFLIVYDLNILDKEKAAKKTSNRFHFLH